MQEHRPWFTTWFPNFLVEWSWFSPSLMSPSFSIMRMLINNNLIFIILTCELVWVLGPQPCTWMFILTTRRTPMFQRWKFPSRFRAVHDFISSLNPEPSLEPVLAPIVRLFWGFSGLIPLQENVRHLFCIITFLLCLLGRPLLGDICVHNLYFLSTNFLFMIWMRKIWKRKIFI